MPELLVQTKYLLRLFRMIDGRQAHWYYLTAANHSTRVLVRGWNRASCNAGWRTAGAGGRDGWIFTIRCLEARKSTANAKPAK